MGIIYMTIFFFPVCITLLLRLSVLWHDYSFHRVLLKVLDNLQTSTVLLSQPASSPGNLTEHHR